MDFKDTMMGKITRGAIYNWGENNEKGEWFIPTPEQADQILSEGGLQLGTVNIDYSSSEKATNNKTYGSEIAAIDGIISLIDKVEGGMSQEEKSSLSEAIKTQIKIQDSLSPEIADRIKRSFESIGVESGIIEVLGIIHDNWVRTNGNKFDDPKRAKKLHQFVDLRLMTYNNDGAIADLIFVQPILEGAGIEVDSVGKLKDEFERQQMAYKDKMEISDCDGLRGYLQRLETNYPPILGLTTSKGKTLETPVLISDVLKNENEVFERMTQQVSKNCGIEYAEPTLSPLGKKAEELRTLLSEKAQIEAIVPPTHEQEHNNTTNIEQ